MKSKPKINIRDLMQIIWNNEPDLRGFNVSVMNCIAL